jgi:hypothetical protein
MHDGGSLLRKSGIKLTTIATTEHKNKGEKDTIG